MTGFLIGIGAGDLQDRTFFGNRVVLEFSSSSAFTAVFYVTVPSGTSGAPAVKGGSATVTPGSSATYGALTVEVALPAGDSIVSVTPVGSLRFNSDGFSNTDPDDSVRKLVRIYSVGNAYTGGISSGGFRNATSLVEVNLPNCTSVGQSTFSGCSALKKFVGGSLGIMYDSGFRDCTRLTDFTATRTANICRTVWNGCSAMTDLSLPGCSLYYSTSDCLGTMSALQYLRFPDKTLAQVKAMSGYEKSISYRKGITLVCSDGSQVIT